ncbi:hypothetical protein SISSUDRAFT_1032502 [Sistotremastrum suecicum HHB10207 ss-3]|uniref:Nuclear segregation protein Bfr1 n=1 Tax=Sistotremastrum suecicum HHB10207 ss-3 TaxID=1314776 RepID=A0A166EI59_9AGAM|nr:hypothetical protein SISSUDRAFT_1032502 [Sistotremastrum suecicum HHB10207 ss-3]
MATAASKSKQKTPKSKDSPKPSAPASGTATPDVAEAAKPAVSGRPDKAVYDAEQAQIKSEIDALQAKINAVKEKISLASRDGPGAERRKALRAELDGIRGEQANIKGSRGKQLDQIKALQEDVAKKIKDLNAAKAKHPYKSVAEVDAHVKKLEAQVDSGSLKLVDEKRALQEISAAKRARRTVENFQKDQEAIEADRARIDELRKQLDDPKSKAVSDRFEAIKKELDSLKAESDEAYASRNKLFDERNALSSQLDTLYARKRESAQQYKESNDRYWAKVNEDRARRAERFRQQKAEEEEAKKKEVAERLREEAEAPAFQAQIEDCQTLIDYFGGKASGATDVTTPVLSGKAELTGVPKLELRQVENDFGEGMTPRKKKGQDEENYFVASKKKVNGSSKPASGAQTPSKGSSSQLNVPLATLSALMSLSIPPPSSTDDVPRTIENLKIKKAWFEANQARVTAENIAKAEANINRLSNGAKTKTASKADPPNGHGENPAEPTPTPQVTDETSVPVASDALEQELESVKETDNSVEAEAVEA